MHAALPHSDLSACQFKWCLHCVALPPPVLPCAVVQSDDPGRDFRGAGLYGLDNLVYLGTHQPALFKQLMLKTQVTGTGREGGQTPPQGGKLLDGLPQLTHVAASVALVAARANAPSGSTRLRWQA